MNHAYQQGKLIGAKSPDRELLDEWHTLCKDSSASTELRHFARGVLMGAAQVKDPSVDHLGGAIKALGLDRPAPLTGEALVLALTRAVDKARDDMGEPIWTPLEAVLPYDWCGGFMFMRAAPGETVDDKRMMFFEYKHGITRKYLIISEDLNAYRYVSGLSEIGQPVYRRVPMDEAIERVFEDIEDLGAERTTKYDDAFIAERNARLRSAGYTIVG